MSLIKAWIYAAGIEQLIYRKCLRKGVKFMGFLLPVPPVREEDGEAWGCLEEAVRNADKNTFFLVTGDREISLFESYGIKRDCIFVFYRRLNQPEGFFAVLDKQKWLKECIVRYVWKYASDEIKTGFFMKKYIDADIRLWNQNRDERKKYIVFLGVDERTDYYVQSLGEKVWGVIPINKEEVSQSLQAFEREFADLLYEEPGKMTFYISNEKLIRKAEGLLKEMGGVASAVIYLWQMV